MSGKLPIISARDAVRAFRRAGFEVVKGKGKGSHVAMAREDWPAILVIPQHGDVSRGTLRALIRMSGLTVEKFIGLL